MGEFNLGKTDSPRVLALMGYDSLFGAELANFQVLQLFRDQGAEVECVVRSCGAQPLVSLLGSAGFRMHEVRFGPSLFGLQRNPWHYFENIKGMWRVYRGMKRAAATFNPTHIYIPNYIQFLYALPAIVALRKPVVFRIGDAPEITFLHRMMWSRVIAPRVAVFVANSQFTRQRLLTAARLPLKSRVVQNCKSERSPANSALRRDENVFRVSYLGQFTASKGVHIAVNVAISICRLREDVYFDFIGLTDPMTAYSEQLLAMVADAGLQHRIQFRKFQADPTELLLRSDIHLCPSLSEESSANVVVEAKRAGVPSVVFPKGGLPELVEHGVDGFVARTADEAGLAEGIQFFLDDAKRLEVARAASLASFNFYTPRVVGPLWKAVLEESAQVRIVTDSSKLHRGPRT